MGGKSKAPPAPDYSGVAAANAEAAQLQFRLGQDQLTWAKEQYASDSAVTNKVVDAALSSQAANDANATADRQRSEQVYQPIEDSLVADANSYASPQRQEYNAGRYSSDVAQQFDAARRSAQAQLESYGVDPTQTRAAALDLSTRTQQAAAQASAMNQSRLNDEATGRALRSDALNIGKGYPSQVAQSYQTALQAGNSAVNSTLAQTQTGAQTMGTSTQYQQLGNQSNAAWGNVLLGADRNNIARYEAQNKSSSGIGSVLGAGLGLVTAFLADGGRVPGEADEGVGAIPDGMGAGMSVPHAASPSGGAQVDDVPARLNAGEFVVPKDVVSFKGEEFFQKLIAQTRKAEQSPDNARPRQQAIPAEAPVLRSALPTG